jgi:uncharacterized protein (DUF2141 family)
MKTLFSLSNLLVMPFWLLIILLPKWKLTERVMRSPWIVLPPALLYAALVVPRFGELMPALMRPDPGTIATFLGTEAGTTIAWLHFLAFDLFVGRWVYLDSRERDLNPWVMAPVLYLCLMFGPLGLALYAGARRLSPRRAVEAAAVIAAVLLAPAALASEPSVLRVVVETPSNEGVVRCAVYTSSETWLSDGFAFSTSAEIADRRATCLFKDLPPGTYAVSAFQDEDRDRELDKNFIGVPSEAYCASNDARSAMGPPSFGDALFKYGGGVVEQRLKAR